MSTDAADETRVWSWEITPHPYDKSFDCMVTDDDDEALQAILLSAEMHLWDGNEVGESRTLTVVHNATKETARG